MKPATIHSAVPVISTDDIMKSLSYYQDVLGFTFDFKYGDPPVYAGVNAGEVELYFTYSPEIVKVLKEKSLHPDLFIWVANADHFYAMHVKAGAEIIEEISDRPWGARQYVVRDVNGYDLKFAQPI